MRVVCFTENLISGGAERQLTELAIMLAQSGHDVSVMVYHGADHYRSRLDEHGIPIEVVTYRNKLHRIIQVKKALQNIKPDAVIGFKRIPAICVELSALFGRTYRLIVSERAFDYLGMSVCVYMCFVLHRLADVVVTNSKSQYDFINEKARWLRKKTVWIPNTVDLQQFYPAKKVKDKTGNRYKLLVLAKFSSQKNPIRFINAVHMFKKSHPDTELTVDWYGSNYFVHGAPTRLSQTYMDVKAEIQRLDLQKCVRTHEPVSDVLALLHECDVVCLPSIYEGYANAIGEAIACGKPVIASRVSDNPLMVKHGINGFLFDPYSIADIAKAITSFISLTDDQKETMGNRSRELAEKIFSPNAFLKAYLKVI